MREHRSEKIHELFVETKKTIRYRRVSVVRGTTLFFYFYFEQYLFRSAQFSDAGLNGALMKRKKQQKTITDKIKTERLSIAKVLEAQFGLDLKCLFRPNPNLFKSCSLLRARGSVFQILNLEEP